MKKHLLNGKWKLSIAGDEFIEGTVPGSVYSILLENGKMEDPYYGDNELAALKIMDHDFLFEKTFEVPEEIKECEQILLRCNGLDTLCQVCLNGQLVGEAFNFHRVWEYDIKEFLKDKNVLQIKIASPVKYIKEMDKKKHFGGSPESMQGFPYLRKPHCMFGWDWGPHLPDAGIWQDIMLLGINGSRIEDVHIAQDHTDGVKLTVCVSQSKNADVRITLTDPDGRSASLENGTAYTVEQPQLWWPNGLGKQPLYTVKVELVENGEILETQEKRIGLRTMTVERKKDQWGESFAHCVNGQTFFAMGADYIPEDNIFSRINPKRTRNLLEQCKNANFNTIRVWGGGYYPTDDFFDSCDELGLVVWQDLMFSCAHYPLDFEFEDNITEEIIENVTRIRHHASLGLWCGNNEMEMFALENGFDGDNLTQAIYIRMYEHIIPHILKKYDPDTFYWPASPSSGGSFDDPNAEDRGDVHYWAVWHSGVPFTEYRKYFFRYASEFGFQSFPSLKTIATFCEPEDYNIFSRKMEIHQRNDAANGRILSYLGLTYLYPTSFEALIYVSQLLQADAIRYGVEHWRRNRGRCMGAIYWQLNDIWPVASWSSIDYYGRWKALHYYAKRFFAPVMISCEEVCETTTRRSVSMEPTPNISTARLNVTNETWDNVEGTVIWSLRNSRSEILESGEQQINVEPFSSIWMDLQDFSDTDYLENHYTYAFLVDGKEVSAGSVLFTAPKHYHFKDPKLSYSLEGNVITVTAENYAKSVEIDCPDEDIVLSDNYFDMEAGSVQIEILKGDPKEITLRSVFDIK